MRNVLPVDEYLYSVVGRTVPVYFPDEAIKAQAVAMRSYALWIAENNNYYYDVRAGEKIMFTAARIWKKAILTN